MKARKPESTKLVRYAVVGLGERKFMPPRRRGRSRRVLSARCFIQEDRRDITFSRYFLSLSSDPRGGAISLRPSMVKSRSV